MGDVAIDVDVEGVADPEHGADAAGEQAPPQVVASAAEVDAPQQQDTGAEEGALGSAEVDPPADADPPGPRNLIEGSADSPLRGWGARMGSADWQLAKEGVLVGVGAGSAARALPLRGEWLFQGEICLEALPEGAPTPQGAGVLIELDGGHAMALRLMRLGPDVLLQVQRMFWDAELGDWAADDVRWQVDVELLEFEPGAEQAVAFKVAFQGEVLSFTWGANRPVPVPDELMGLEWPVSVGLFVNQERTRFSELMLEVLP